nr:probable serine/threonine-protein kinase HSL1 [Parasteatoda tepidariorum]
MNESLIKPSRLKEVLKFLESKSYEFNQFLNKGNFTRCILFKNKYSKKEIIAKLVVKPAVGELHYWSELRQINLNPLLHVVTAGQDMYIFISPFERETLRDVLNSSVFLQHPKCFQRKLFFVKGILKGLEYLHQKSLCLLNVCDENIAICKQTENAIICNFSTLSSIDDIKISNISHPGVSKPPELIACGKIDGPAIDIWSCGIICLQMFTRYILPSYNHGNNILKGLTIDLLNQVNFGSNFDESVLNLKTFLGALLAENPHNRISASGALSFSFLNMRCERIDKRARNYWRKFDSEKSNIEKPKQRKRSNLKKSTASTNKSVQSHQTSVVNELKTSLVEELRSSLVNSKKNKTRRQLSSFEMYKCRQSNQCYQESPVKKTTSHPNFYESKKSHYSSSSGKLSSLSFSSPTYDSRIIKEVDDSDENISSTSSGKNIFGEKNGLNLDIMALKPNQNHTISLSKEPEENFVSECKTTGSRKVDLNLKKFKIKKLSSESSNSEQSKTNFSCKKGVSSVSYEAFESRLNKSVENSAELTEKRTCSGRNEEIKRDKFKSSTKTREKFIIEQDTISLRNANLNIKISKAGTRSNKSSNLNLSQTYVLSKERMLKKSIRNSNESPRKFECSSQKELRENQNGTLKLLKENDENKNTGCQTHDASLNFNQSNANSPSINSNFKPSRTSVSSKNCKGSTSHGEFDTKLRKTVQNHDKSTAKINYSNPKEFKKTQKDIIKLREEIKENGCETENSEWGNLNIIKSKINAPGRENTISKRYRACVPSKAETKSTIYEAFEDKKKSTRNLSESGKVIQCSRENGLLAETEKNSVTEFNADETYSCLDFNKLKIKNSSIKNMESKQFGNVGLSTISVEELETELKFTENSAKSYRKMEHFIQTKLERNQNRENKLSKESEKTFISESEIVDSCSNGFDSKNCIIKNLSKNSVKSHQHKKYIKSTKDLNGTVHQKFEAGLSTYNKNFVHSSNDSMSSRENELEAYMIGNYLPNTRFPKHMDSRFKIKKTISISLDAKHISRTTKDSKDIHPPFEVVITDCAEIDRYKEKKIYYSTSVQYSYSTSTIAIVYYSTSEETDNFTHVCVGFGQCVWGPSRFSYIMEWPHRKV